MVEVIINGSSIDLISKGVKYIKQANDLSDLSTVNTSFTYSLKADKTPKNTRLFKQLGMIGDTSNFPYLKNTAQLIEDGTVLIEKGIPNIKNTNEGYDLFIQDGIINFFKEIENKTLGIDLDLSEVNHDKNFANVVGSWNNNLPYRYLIADYNGKTEDETGIDLSYQVPSLSMRYLWDKVLEYSGYTYSGDFSFLDSKWLTYPKPPEIEETNLIEHLEIRSKSYYSINPTNEYKQWNTPTTLNGVTLINGWKILINTTGIYTITYSGNGGVLYNEERAEEEPIGLELYIDGVKRSYSSSTAVPKVSTIEILAGQLIELRVPDIDLSANRLVYADIAFLDLSITSSSRETVNFTEVLGDFKIKDFVKEVIIRGALTPYTDVISKHISFDSLKERLNVSDSEDLSKFYVKRTNESYTFSNYAQKNNFTLKYNNEEEKYYNGAIYVSNANIDAEKDLFQSNLYAPDKYTNSILLEPGRKDGLLVLKLWDKNIKEVGGVQEIEYKALNNKFYLVTSEMHNRNISISGQDVSKYYKASSKGTSMQEVINDKWNQTHRIFEDTRIHEIELNLSAYNFMTIDVRKMKYIDQEGQFYILNRLIWETGRTAIGEFLRVKKI